MGRQDGTGPRPSPSPTTAGTAPASPERGMPAMPKTETIPLPISPLVKAACYGCGALLLLSAGLAALLLWEAATARPLVALPGGFMWSVVAPVMLAFQVLSTPSQTEKLRRELLARREAGEPDVTFVERKPVADSAMLAVMFGITAFVA